MRKKSNDQYSAAEAERRFEAARRGARLMGAPGDEIAVTRAMIDAAWDYFYDHGYEWPAGEYSSEEFFAGLYRRMAHVALDMKVTG